MTFVSVADACRRLGIDAKTLHHWLAEAQLSLDRHPGDGRKKGMSEEHLELLARRHQRSLTPSAPGARSRRTANAADGAPRPARVARRLAEPRLSPCSSR